MIAKNIKKPPTIVLFEGTSLIPSIGTQTQKIPPKDSPQTMVLIVMRVKIVPKKPNTLRTN